MVKNPPATKKAEAGLTQRDFEVMGWKDDGRSYPGVENVVDKEKREYLRIEISQCEFLLKTNREAELDVIEQQYSKKVKDSLQNRDRNSIVLVTERQERMEEVTQEESKAFIRVKDALVKEAMVEQKKNFLLRQRVTRNT